MLERFPVNHFLLDGQAAPHMKSEVARLRSENRRNHFDATRSGWMVLACVFLSMATVTRADDGPIRGCRGTYASPPLKADGHVDVEALLGQLKELHANTYSFLIFGPAEQWSDLKQFLPLAREAHINVWVTLVPPSEAKQSHSMPFKEDYEQWGVELAKLSVEQPNLVAWSIDDFVYNAKIITPQRLRAILEKSKAINPKLAFVPCCYYRESTPQFANAYAGLFDGILFPYYNDSGSKRNLTDPTHVKREIAGFRERFGPKVPIVVDVYSSSHSTLGSSTPQYVKEVITQAMEEADGVMVYRHPNPEADAQKYQVVKEVFAK